MILSPEEIREKYGPLFSRRLLTMIDPRRNIAEIVETCAVQGTVEWDAVNRCRAGGVLEWCKVTGDTMVMRARLGESTVRFGPSDTEQGGQALEGIIVEGDTVRTKWAGIGGAGLGMAACLAQAPGVLSVYYPHEDDMKVGGNRTNRAHVITWRYEKITIGIDDTDDKEGGATWVLALKASRLASELDGVESLGLKLIQLYPKSPHKTTNCVSSAIIFAARLPVADTLIGRIVETVKAQTRSKDTGIAVYRGIGISGPLERFGREAKKRIVSLGEAEAFGQEASLSLIEVGEGKEGRIGALAAVALSEQGIEAAALDNDEALRLIRK